MIPSKEQVDNLSAIEDITFIGYPSGLYDEKININNQAGNNGDANME